MNKSHT